jgi:hypothetical protein
MMTVFPVKRFPSRRVRVALAGSALCCIAASVSAPAVAQERFAGDWVVANAVVAPWASDPKDPTDQADAKRILGKRLAIGKGFLRAPEPLGCAKPTYALRDATADTLFEGSLNTDGANKPTDPEAAARALGITQKTVRGMTASCSEVEFLLIDPDTMLFGLNNRVFTAKRAK